VLHAQSSISAMHCATGAPVGRRLPAGFYKLGSWGSVQKI